MNYLLLLSNVIKTNTTCPLSGGGYSCMCDGGAIYCPSVCIEYCSCKTQCYFFLLVDLVEESILIHIIFFIDEGISPTPQH